MFNFYRFFPVLACLIFLLNGSVSAQQAVIPFELTSSNNIVVKVILNDRDTVKLMFHTAANSITLTEDGLKKTRSVMIDGSDTVGAWGGEGNISKFSKSNKISLGDKVYSAQPIWVNTNSGPGTDGKFGIDLFEGKSFAINFDRNEIVTDAAIDTTFQRLDLVFKNDMMFIGGQFKIHGSALSNELLIHSGYAGTILLDDKFAADNRLADSLKITGEKKLKDSYGNVVITRKAMMPLLVIGSVAFADLPVGFFSGQIGRQKVSVLGGDLLRRFNIIISADRKSVYLAKSKYFSEPFNNS